MNRKMLFVALTAVVALLSSSAWSQGFDGTLRGTVVDPSGAVVPGATVTATNEQTAVARSATTTPAGSYVFPNMLVGPYTVTVEAGKFQKYQRTKVEVLPNQVVTADVKLAVGSATTTVEVSAGTATVQTDTV
jgi:hypothetical protein